MQSSPASPSPSEEVAGPSWLSPRATGVAERLAYAGVGAVLLLVGLAGFGLAVLAWSGADVLLGLFGVLLGVLACWLGYRMILAAAQGRRMYWWPGQREYDRGGSH